MLNLTTFKHRYSLKTLIALVTALILLLYFGCNSPSESSQAIEKQPKSLTNPEPDGGTIYTSAPSSPSDTDSENPHDEGSARPKRILKDDPILERPEFSKPAPGQMIAIPKGTLTAGSLPQDRLRIDYAEVDMEQIPMTSFEIDALPYPGDPNRPFLTNVTRTEAAKRCAQAGKRLCTELEWEWACKSADARRYPTGNQYIPAAYDETTPYEPASPFGVFAMGRLMEWTSGPWGEEADQIERGVAKGYAEGQDISPIRGRRCAMRTRLMPDGAGPTLGFRCCKGPENTGKYITEPVRPPFSLYKTMKPAKFAHVIQSIPELEAVHDNPHMYSDSDIRTVLARRNSDREELAKQGIHFRWKPMRWIPRQGMELWVAVGRSNRHAFIVALHEVKDNEEYAHASSLILWNQPAPLALVYRSGHRNELYWAPCWNCRDGGTITFDEEKNEIIITHRW